MSAVLIDLRGRRFGSWVVLIRAPNRGGIETAWTCRCDCGWVDRVASGALRYGTSTRCNRCRVAAIKVPDEERVCRWCARQTAGSRVARECCACNRMAFRNGRDAEGRPIAKGKRRVLASAQERDMGSESA
ncbi:MAG: hypothetical protein IT579_25190 [Verrucomicrobia subdivision 3 bacterium]|nr:hypothetical protein [Limisphaerales bacterium]